MLEQLLGARVFTMQGLTSEFVGRVSNGGSWNLEHARRRLSQVLSEFGLSGVLIDA